MTSVWKVTDFVEMAVLQRGFDLPHRDRRDGVVPIVTSSGCEDVHSVARVNGPGVITGRYGTIVEVFFVREAFWPLNTTLYVKDFCGNDPKYIYYLLKTIDFASHSGKSGVPGVNRNDLHKLEVACPTSIDEQQAIAEALSDADALIESLEQLIVKKQLIKQGAMQELLTGKRRLPGFDGEWRRVSIGALLEVCHGRSQSAVENSTGDIPILATGGKIGWSCESLYEKPSVLIGRKGTIDRPQYMDSPFWTVDTLFYTKVLGSNSAKYLFYQFCLIPWKKYNEASGVPSLNASTIEAIEISAPAPVEQVAIPQTLTDIDTEITALESRLTKAHQIKQGMMRELLTGRIRLMKPDVQVA